MTCSRSWLSSSSRERQQHWGSALTWAVVLWFPAGCARVTAVSPERREHAPLRLVHVCSESGMRAGFPIDAYRVLSTMSWNDAIPGATADGLPLQHTAYPGQPIVYGGRDPAKPPELALLVSASRCFSPSAPVSGEAPPVVGTPVTIAGYFLPTRNMAPTDFWRVPASLIPARVVRPPAPHSAGEWETDEAIWIEAPPGDYRGFRGGPVLVSKPGARAVIVAVITDCAVVGHSDKAILSARLIPSSLSKVGSPGV